MFTIRIEQRATSACKYYKEVKMTQKEIDQNVGFIAFIERMGKRIPDPVIIFIYFLVGALALTAVMGGLRFETYGAAGEPVVH